ncbi:GyrI-like domain-containing protein [Lysinibacillus sp. NPDC097195]|uniref:AraC family transcriptional regulator n=1 Tax=Lysinibacillus sp. NPDC097195 TaxID=3364141 RepID=UPI0037F65AB6
MKFTIEELAPSKIAFFRNVGEYGEANKMLMESFKQWVQNQKTLKNQYTILAIPQDNPDVSPKEQCRYDVCICIERDFHVTQPAQVGTFAGGKYAVFLLDHTKEAVSEFWGKVFSEITKQQLAIRPEPIIERYSAQMIERHLCEILVPIH